MTKSVIPEPRKISAGEKEYPVRLRQIFGELLPPDLWFVGNIDLLKKRGVGFCGSRKASDAGLTIAADCAEQLSQHKVIVISGYASGVDMASHESALLNGGSTIIVLPEGIDHFRIKRTIKEIWDWNRVLVISYFPREAIWRADRAMERNKAIVGLSDAVIVLEAGDRGGTLNAGYRALETHKPLFVVFFEDMADGREGNRQLIERGGIPLQRSRSTGKANLKSIFQIIESSAPNRF
ncbi:MAG: DNA-processing protein DprA [Afipia sp.]|nr:DNA-processing protein DprA [Afipia sp.]